MTGSVRDWSAAVPGGVEGLAADLRSGVSRGTSVCDPVRPGAIAAGRWRRMSRLARLAAVAVQDLVDRNSEVDWSSLPLVHGSAMGEVVPSSRFLDRMFLEGPDRASPLAFQNSVYNATGAHLSLVFGLKGPAETISAGMATGLMALSRAMEWLESAPAVLVVVGDDLNPTTLNAYANTSVAAGECVVAALIERGVGVSVRDGVHGSGLCRGVALPYERRFVALEGIRPEASVGLCCTSGLLAVLCGLRAIDQDDGLAITGWPSDLDGSGS